MSKKHEPPTPGSPRYSHYLADALVARDPTTPGPTGTAPPAGSAAPPGSLDDYLNVPVAQVEQEAKDVSGMPDDADLAELTPQQRVKLLDSAYPERDELVTAGTEALGSSPVVEKASGIEASGMADLQEKKAQVSRLVKGADDLTAKAQGGRRMMSFIQGKIAEQMWALLDDELAEHAGDEDATQRALGVFSDATEIQQKWAKLAQDQQAKSATDLEKTKAAFEEIQGQAFVDQTLHKLRVNEPVEPETLLQAALRFTGQSDDEAPATGKGGNKVKPGPAAAPRSAGKGAPGQPQNRRDKKR